MFTDIFLRSVNVPVEVICRCTCFTQENLSRLNRFFMRKEDLQAMQGHGLDVGEGDGGWWPTLTYQVPGFGDNFGLNLEVYIYVVKQPVDRKVTKALCVCVCFSRVEGVDAPDLWDTDWDNEPWFCEWNSHLINCFQGCTAKHRPSHEICFPLGVNLWWLAPSEWCIVFALPTF